LQAELVAKALTPDEVKQWHAHARKMQRLGERTSARAAREYRARLEAAQQRRAGG